ncbi:MAG: phosphoglycolate phosphatase [Betaproteobacteria bacterium]
MLVEPEVTRSFVVDAVAFDLDGTLLDTIHDIATAVNVLLVEEHLAPLPKDAVRDLVGKGMHNLLSRALALRGAPPRDDASMAQLLTRYQVHYASVLGRETVAYPGVMFALDQLRGRGFKLAVVTNKASRFVRPHLEHAGMADYFAAVVGGDDAVAKKPDAAPVLLAAQQLGVAPARMLMVGDSANDVDAARAAGSPVLAVPYGYNEGRSVQSFAADGIVDSLADLPAWVRRD